MAISMIRCIRLMLFITFTASFSVYAQPHRTSAGEMPHNQHNQGRRTVVLNIDTRVLDGEQKVIWNETNQKIATPGSPVNVQLVGSNIVVTVQFTPFLRRNVLVAQGQIWIGDPQVGVSYYTFIQTIPMEIGEPIHFFPLGQSKQLDASIEIVITVNPNSEVSAGNER